MPIDLQSALNATPRPAPVRGSWGISMAGYQTIVPKEAPAAMLDPLSGAGVQLTRTMLLILSVAILLLLSISAYQENAYRRMAADAYASVLIVGQASESGLTDAQGRAALLEAISRQAELARDYWMKVAQMILLNLLLPVLTALLGYIFGSRQSNR